MPLAFVLIFYDCKLCEVFLLIVIPILIFWPRCTNCGLPYSSGKLISNSKFDIPLFQYSRRYFPGSCARCHQDHWNPYGEPNTDWVNYD